MPDPNQTNQDTGTIDSRVGTLLKEARDAASRVERDLDGTPEVRTAPPDAAGEAKTAVTAPPQAAIANPEGRPSVDDASDIGQLDDDLARLTESLIEQEQLTPASATPAPRPESPPQSVAPAAPLPVPPAPVQAAAPPPNDMIPTPAAAVAPPPPARPAPAAAVPSTVVPAEAAVETKNKRASRVVNIGAVAAAAEPVVLGGLSALSGPLLKRPRIIRDTAGWVALWTMFLAVCVWGYMLFVHKPAAPAPATSPIELVTGERAAVHATPESAPAEGGHESAKDAGRAADEAKHGAEQPSGGGSHH